MNPTEEGAEVSKSPIDEKFDNYRSRYQELGKKQSSSEGRLSESEIKEMDTLTKVAIMGGLEPQATSERKQLIEDEIEADDKAEALIKNASPEQKAELAKRRQELGKKAFNGDLTNEERGELKVLERIIFG